MTHSQTDEVDTFTKKETKEIKRIAVTSVKSVANDFVNSVLIMSASLSISFITLEVIKKMLSK